MLALVAASTSAQVIHRRQGTPLERTPGAVAARLSSVIAGRDVIECSRLVNRGTQRLCAWYPAAFHVDVRPRLRYRRPRPSHEATARRTLTGLLLAGPARGDRSDDRRHRRAAHHRVAAGIRSLSGVATIYLLSSTVSVPILREPVGPLRPQAVLHGRRDAVRRPPRRCAARPASSRFCRSTEWDN